MKFLSIKINKYFYTIFSENIKNFSSDQFQINSSIIATKKESTFDRPLNLQSSTKINYYFRSILDIQIMIS